MSEITRGSSYVSNPAERLAHRHLIQVARMAKDGSWADIQVMSWAVGWKKRQTLVGGTFLFPHEPFTEDPSDWFDAQQEDHMTMRKEVSRDRI